jgi:hypothetical protein
MAKTKPKAVRPPTTPKGKRGKRVLPRLSAEREPERATCRSCGEELSRCIDCEIAEGFPIRLGQLLEVLDEVLPSMPAWDLVDVHRVIEREVERRGGLGCADLRPVPGGRNAEAAASLQT